MAFDVCKDAADAPMIFGLFAVLDALMVFMFDQPQHRRCFGAFSTSDVVLSVYS